MTTTVDADLYRAEIERLQRMNTRLQAELAKLVPAHAEAYMLLGLIAWELSPAVTALPAERIGKVCRLLDEFQIEPNGGHS